MSETVCNYRISRARRIIENTFGISASRFRVFRRPIVARVETVINVIKAVIALHNFLIISSPDNDSFTYCADGYADQETTNGRRAGQWRRVVEGDQGLISLTQVGSRNYSHNAKQVRDNFRDYFNGPAAVSWQWNHINSTVNFFDEE